MIPKDFLSEGIRIAEDSKIFGVKFSDLSREELLAAAAHGWTEEARWRKLYMDSMLHTAESLRATAAFASKVTHAHDPD